MTVQVLGDAVTVRFFMPSAELSPYISTYYLTEVSSAGDLVIEDWLHPEWANLRIFNGNLCEAAIGPEPIRAARETIVTGPTSCAAHFRLGPTRVWGIGILPKGWARFTDMPAANMADRFCHPDDEPALGHFADLRALVFSGPADPAEEARRIDAYFRGLLATRPPNEDEHRIRSAHGALMESEIGSVSELSEQLGISSRSLERLSLRAFGFSPKLLLRRQRFLRSLAQFMLDPSLSWIKTLDWQYVDQAHFVRDFKRFMGMSPSRYAALEHPVLRAAARARAAAAGEAVQALHRP